MFLHHDPPHRPPDPRRLREARWLADAARARASRPGRQAGLRVLALTACLAVAVGVATLAAGARPAAGALQPSTAVTHWNRIAEDTVLRSGAFQNEGLLYMAYVSAAVYDAVAAIDGRYEPYASAVTAADGASVDAAVAEAAYRTLVHHFPAQGTTLAELHELALAAIADGSEKEAGITVGAAAARGVLTARIGDGLVTPIGSTSTIATRSAAPGVWRPTGPAFAAPQTPWVADMRPFVLPSADAFLPDPPPPLASVQWAESFTETAAYGGENATARSADQTAVARFWSANVIRQYNALVRDLAAARGLDAMATARLAALVNVVGADAQIAVMRAKYRYLLWRPVTAIDPTSVAADGLGPTPGFVDGNETTIEQTGWRPLLTTPNHPEYPAAHGSITSAVAEVVRSVLGTNHVELAIRGFSAAGAAGNLDAVRTFAKPSDLRREIVDARVWAGVHYRFSGTAGVALGRDVAKYDLAHAFRAR